MDKYKSFFKNLSPEKKDLLISFKIKYEAPIPKDTIVQDVLFLIDSPRLLLSLQSIRARLGINSVPFLNPEKLLRKIYEGIELNEKYLANPINSIAESLKDPIHWNTILNLWSPKSSSLRDKLELETTNLSYYFGKSFSREIAQQAILLGIVGWGFKPIRILSQNYPISFPTYALIVHPRMTYTELEANFKKIRDLYIRSNNDNINITDTYQNANSYHEWHWKNIAGYTIRQIAESVVGDKAYDYGQISKGLIKYRMMLTY